MKRVNVNNAPRARLLAIAATVAVISACGGGGGGGFPVFPITPPPVPAPAPIADGLAPCFNEADFREGTLLEFEAAKPGSDPATASFQRKSVTEGREAFGGANPVAFNVDSQTVSAPQYQRSMNKKEYKDLVNGSILLYGKASTEKTTITPLPGAPFPADFPLEQVFSVSQVYTPPFSFPIDMKPGQVASQQSSVKKTTIFNGRSDPTISLPATGELTYHGREKLETPMGTFDTCKLSLKITVGASPISKEATKEFWLAAEGPYRGQLLKGVDPKSPMVVTKMTYSPK